MPRHHKEIWFWFTIHHQENDQDVWYQKVKSLQDTFARHPKSIDEALNTSELKDGILFGYLFLILFHKFTRNSLVITIFRHSNIEARG